MSNNPFRPRRNNGKKSAQFSAYVPSQATAPPPQPTEIQNPFIPTSPVAPVVDAAQTTPFQPSQLIQKPTKQAKSPKQPKQQNKYAAYVPKQEKSEKVEKPEKVERPKKKQNKYAAYVPKQEKSEKSEKQAEPIQQFKPKRVQTEAEPLKVEKPAKPINPFKSFIPTQKPKRNQLTNPSPSQNEVDIAFGLPTNTFDDVGVDIPEELEKELEELQEEAEFQSLLKSFGPSFNFHSNYQPTITRDRDQLRKINIRKSTKKVRKNHRSRDELYNEAYTVSVLMGYDQKEAHHIACEYQLHFHNAIYDVPELAPLYWDYLIIGSSRTLIEEHIEEEAEEFKLEKIIFIIKRLAPSLTDENSIKKFAVFVKNLFTREIWYLDDSDDDIISGKIIMYDTVPRTDFVKIHSYLSRLLPTLNQEEFVELAASL